MIIKHINVSALSPEWFEEQLGNMSESKKQLVLKTRVEQKRKLRIASDAVCRTAISGFCGISPADIVFEYNEHGKPYVKGIPVHFNVSHSGDIAICAVSEHEIGIDIEKIRDIDQRITRRFATDDEKSYIDTHANGLFEIWTLKEAFFKCKGTGLGPDIKSVSFTVKGDSVECSESGYSLGFHHVDKNYICSICEKTALD